MAHRRTVTNIPTPKKILNLREEGGNSMMRQDGTREGRRSRTRIKAVRRMLIEMLVTMQITAIFLDEGVLRS